jgi:hypothetical protein
VEGRVVESRNQMKPNVCIELDSWYNAQDLPTINMLNNLDTTSLNRHNLLNLAHHRELDYTALSLSKHNSVSVVTSYREEYEVSIPARERS